MKANESRKKIIAERFESSHFGFMTDQREGYEQCAICGINDKSKTVDFGYIYINRSWEIDEHTLCLGCLETIRKLIKTRSEKEERI